MEIFNMHARQVKGVISQGEGSNDSVDVLKY